MTLMVTLGARIAILLNALKTVFAGNKNVTVIQGLSP